MAKVRLGIKRLFRNTVANFALKNFNISKLSPGVEKERLLKQVYLEVVSHVMDTALYFS